MTEPNNEKFRAKETRRRLAISAAFPYPRELAPTSGFGAFMSQGLMDEIFFMVREGNVQMEHMGMLLGYWNQDPNTRIQWIDITRALPAPSSVIANPLGVEISAQDVARMGEIAESIAISESIYNLGWYHSHPGLGIFFSGIDRDNQARSHSQPHRIGLVVDPIRNQYGAYRGADSAPYDLRVLPVPLPGTITADQWNHPSNRIHTYKTSATDEVLKEMEEINRRRLSPQSPRPYFKRRN